jgi:hypothetical protein
MFFATSESRGLARVCGSFLAFLLNRSILRVAAIDGLQVDQATDSQPLLVSLSSINHAVYMLGEDFPCL